MDNMLEITNLSKTYKGSNKPAVNNISLSLKPGEIFGFLGEGVKRSRKSTTFKCITGIQSFDEGTVTINGYDINKEQLEAKQSLAYIPDNHATFEELTGLEYINFMADVYKVTLEDRKNRIDKFATMFSMEHALNTVIKGIFTWYETKNSNHGWYYPLSEVMDT